MFDKSFAPMYIQLLPLIFGDFLRLSLQLVQLCWQWVSCWKKVKLMVIGEVKAQCTDSNCIAIDILGVFGSTNVNLRVFVLVCMPYCIPQCNFYVSLSCLFIAFVIRMVVSFPDKSLWWWHACYIIGRAKKQWSNKCFIIFPYWFGWCGLCYTER